MAASNCVGQCFRERNPTCRIVAVEPNESCTLMCGDIGRHLIEGIADGFVPGIFARHQHLIDEMRRPAPSLDFGPWIWTGATPPHRS